MNPYPLQKTAFLLHLALLLCLIDRAGAASFVWTGEGHSEDWNDPANWSSSSYPGRDGDHDEAVVGRLPGGPAIARVSSPLTLSRLRIQEGSYVSGATLTVSTAFDWTGGELQTSLVVGPNAVLTMDGDDLKDLSGATTVLDLMGHTIVSGTGQIRLSSEASVINRGTMTLLGAAEVTGSRCCAEPSS